MDCWPCTMVYSISDLTGHINKSFNIGLPYTRIENNTKVKMNALIKIYWSNYDTFNQDAKRISSNNESFK